MIFGKRMPATILVRANSGTPLKARYQAKDFRATTTSLSQPHKHLNQNLRLRMLLRRKSFLQSCRRVIAPTWTLLDSLATKALSQPVVARRSHQAKDGSAATRAF